MTGANGGTHEERAHKERMKVMQAEQRRKRAAATNPGHGLVLVYTGDGKGKSSSAFGVMARALGWGQTIGVVQFIKGNWVTGGAPVFRAFPGSGGLAHHGRRFYLGYSGPHP
jgi:cob(I)alamin adenosyltransferase